MREFDPEKIQIVDINNVHPNSWNPKISDTDEYRKIVESIRINGLKSPVIVREKPDEENIFEVLDGEQRLTAAKQLGFEKIYIYNLGNISDEEAKSVTIWMEQQVKFNELQLAPLVVELSDLKIQVPYSDDEVQDFANMLSFDFIGDGKETLSVKCTPEQLDRIKEALNVYCHHNDVEEDVALVEMVKLGGKRYE